MGSVKDDRRYMARMTSLVTDPDFLTITRKYCTYLDTNNISEVFELFDVVPSLPGAASCGKLIWTSTTPVPPDLKMQIINIYCRHFL
ncbi:hypothetical protein [Mucilaginibacter agri]|uniref:Uncharacterized protein n=1 Tax=Mucilaginibacter agri TaxID=2695265 RepID=A0A965ZJW6_9SPHI|nr:hypothetical protein [Mucilaginibacter agri]NCD72528.1 hypothetical protein [Mucilaginibacter agri]